jgi:hypothetical protein
MIGLLWQANGDATILARLCTRDGSGGPSPVPSEGNLNTSVDYGSPGSITLSVYDVTEGGALTYTATLTPSSVVTALQTGGIFSPPNAPDGRGCNFLADVPGNAFPVAHHLYRIVVQAVTSGGVVGWGVWEAVASPTIPPN